MLPSIQLLRIRQEACLFYYLLITKLFLGLGTTIDIQCDTKNQIRKQNFKGNFHKASSIECFEMKT